MKILMLGSLPETEKRKKIYEGMVSVCKDFADEIMTPIDTANFNGSEKERYERAFETVKKADLIIGEQSEPSTGQGMELREAAILKKPVIVVAREGSKISGLVKGAPNIKKIIYYSDLEDLKDKLEQALK